MTARRKARELALKALYVMDLLGVKSSEAWKIIDHDEKNEKIEGFARELVEGTEKNLDFIDRLIFEYARNWEMDRIAKVDKAIIRMGLYEIYFEENIPKNASINEAVELAKYYSTSKSHKFINGILDSCSRKSAKADENR
ncbi:MAG: transcription antitermination factor NusB [Elusimicrobia bacterium]|nr:transcription antitermination factor NusB [Elusimicrobiota bacterium]